MQVSGLAVQDTEMQNVDGGIQGLKKKLEAGDDEEKTEKVSCEIIHPLRAWRIQELIFGGALFRF